LKKCVKLGVVTITYFIIGRVIVTIRELRLLVDGNVDTFGSTDWFGAIRVTGRHLLAVEGCELATNTLNGSRLFRIHGKMLRRGPIPLLFTDG
jgi:hypothetical protein